MLNLLQDNSSDSKLPKWKILVEISLIFVIFFIQGAWPVPDVNEPHYLGKAFHYWNPAWAAGDFFLESPDTHKVFYFTFGWLSLWLTPTCLAWTGRIVTWWLLAWSWRRLSFAIIPSASWSILSAALFAMFMDRCHMAGEWVIGGVEAKGFAFVLVFLGLEALVRNRWNRAWLLFGAGSAFHVLVGGWAFFAAALAWLHLNQSRSQMDCPDFRRDCPDFRLNENGTVPFTSVPTEVPRLKTMLPALLGGFLLALPGILPAALQNLNVDAATILLANQIYVFERLPHHLNLFHIEPIFIIRLLLLTECYFILSWAISLAGKSRAADQPSVGASRGIMTTDSTAKRTFLAKISDWKSISDSYNAANPTFLRFRAFVLGAIVISLVGAAINMLIFINDDWAAALLKFYWFRQTDVVIPMAVAILASKLLADSRSSWPKTCLITAIFIGFALINHFGDLTLKRLQPSMPRADRVANPLDWRDACLWASDDRNIPPNARFITPRMSQSLKWYAHRAEVATWKDIPQNAKDLVQWRARIQDLFVPEVYDPHYRWHESLNELGPERIKKLAKKYKADYMITETSDPPLSFKLIYKNKSYSIYKL